MTVERVDHTAIAVQDLDEALKRYHRLLGLRVASRDRVPDQKVEIAFLAGGDTLLELITPTDADSGVARFLERRGEGLHHVGLLVDDIRRELQRLAEEGVELIDHEPRRSVHGLIAFVHPRGTGGVLLELVQHSRGSPAANRMSAPSEI